MMKIDIDRNIRH